MYDKNLIEKICNLSCTKEELYTNQSTINYDCEFPFKKYYHIDIIISAFNKYLSKEWDEHILARWCCIYMWILRGGFSKNLKEDLNFLEEFLVDTLIWELDSLTFCDEREDNIYSIIENFKTLDHVWQTRNSWKGVYATIGEFDLSNGDQYVLLINEELKEYIIIFSTGHLSNNYQHQNEYLRYTTKNKFVKLVEKIKNKYKNISHSEEYYYSDLNDYDK